MQQVSGRVIAPDRVAPLGVDGKLRFGGRRPADLAAMNDQVGNRLYRVFDDHLEAVAFDDPGIADLSARFSIEGSLVGNQLTMVDDAQDAAARAGGLVTE